MRELGSQGALMRGGDCGGAVGSRTALGGGGSTSQISQETSRNHEHPRFFIDFPGKSMDSHGFPRFSKFLKHGWEVEQEYIIRRKFQCRSMNRGYALGCFRTASPENCVSRTR